MADTGGFFQQTQQIARRAFGTMADTTVATFAAGGSSSYLMPAIVGVVAIVLIVIVVVVSLQVGAAKPKKLVTGPIDLWKPASPIVVDRASTKALMSNSYTFAFYVRIDAVPDVRAQATALLNWPGIWSVAYNPAQEQMLWSFRPSPDSASGWSYTDAVTVPRIPLQRWTQVVITLEGRSMDFYTNGHLVKSELLTNVPAAGAASITLAPEGLMGQLAYIQVWPRRLTVGEVAANYTDTSDSRGQPFLGSDFIKPLTDFKLPNIFCPEGGCGGKDVTAQPSQTWEFPYQ